MPVAGSKRLVGQAGHDGLAGGACLIPRAARSSDLDVEGLSEDAEVGPQVAAPEDVVENGGVRASGPRLVGCAEIGKSSLVRAGLIPSLSEAWGWAILRPSENPTANLIAALNKPNAQLKKKVAAKPEELLAVDRESGVRSGVGAIAPLVRESRWLLIVVDQFDELFRYQHCRRLTDRARYDADFVDLLVKLTKTDQAQIHVLVTLRSDFKDRCKEVYPHVLDSLYPDSSDPELPMEAGHLRQTIEEPTSEWVLPVKLVEEMSQARFPGHLPIMQHALRRAWDLRRTSDKKDPAERTADAWKRLAPVTKERGDSQAQDWPLTPPSAALLRHAEKIYEECDPAEQKLVDKLLRTIVAKVDGGFVRRPMSISRISKLWRVDVDGLIRVVKRFQKEGQTFLMPPPTGVPDADTIADISYDSFVWALGSKWDHSEYPLLLADGRAPAQAGTPREAHAEEAGDEAGGKRRRLLAVFAALLSLSLLLLLAAFLSSWDHRTVEPITVYPTERFGGVFGDVYFGDLTEEGGDIHLTDEHVREIGIAAGDESGDFHLTEGDIKRIRRAIGDLIFRVEGCCPAAPQPSLVSRASTGPALQHGDLAELRRGFVYDLEKHLKEGEWLKLPELGLELKVDPFLCPDPDAQFQLRVRRLSETPELDSVHNLFDSERCFSWRIKGRDDRDQEWSDYDTWSAAQFPGPEPPGFHYAILVSRDGSGPYVIVRKCAAACEQLEGGG